MSVFPEVDVLFLEGLTILGQQGVTFLAPRRGPLPVWGPRFSGMGTSFFRMGDFVFSEGGPPATKFLNDGGTFVFPGWGSRSSGWADPSRWSERAHRG